MKGFDGDPRLRRLFCFTHPDDELGIAAWVRRLAGSERHDSAAEVHLSWTHRTPVREVEARAAASAMGVPESNLHFHAGEDGRVCEQLDELLSSFVAMMDRVKPDVVVCAAFEQGHLDHDATHWLVAQSFHGPVFEYPMYHPYTRRIQTMGRFADPAGEEVLALTADEGTFKNHLSKSYRSQNIRSVVFWYSVYRALILKPAMFRKFERLRPVGPVDYLTPNLPEPMRSQVAKSAQWSRWLAAMQHRLETHR